jgi:hypothetical protein
MATQGYQSANVNNLTGGASGAGQIVCARAVHQYEAAGQQMKVIMSGNGSTRTNAPALGISQEFPRGTPGTPWATQVASPAGQTRFLATDAAGQPLLVYEEGEECVWETGGSFFSGQYLTWDIDGRAIAVSEGGGQYVYYLAQAKGESTGAGQFVRVVIKKGLIR